MSWVAGNPAATAEDKAVAELIAQDKQPGEEQRPAADHLVKLGYLCQRSDGTYEALAGDPRKWRP
ncbi:hypothetical protein BST14_08130 [Mycobacterium arosiense ATCC BAA-1401 = DSM 45069]|uniref:Uncharacterized protein n=1 Tax=Mycobacterium arosiense ATCC BAA-1401 = DSM 45069 TaxID=1265311 RepID=A0A1W9ZLB5_MYCAI|nr:hypothetical protein BST14_08130 [Mycobacterium arosiense ATCC BAA-1401 = DSM 45069]